MQSPNESSSSSRPSILHVSSREVLRVVRDQILRVSGYDVTSCETHDEAREAAKDGHFDLVLIDVDGEYQVKAAGELCSALKQTDPDQRVAFVCNWRVAILNECPDDIVRSEFDPVSFVTGVAEVLKNGA